jgi:hypothetical protein
MIWAGPARPLAVSLDSGETNHAIAAAPAIPTATLASARAGRLVFVTKVATTPKRAPITEATT